MDEYIHRFSGQQIDDAVEAVINGNVGGGGGETGEETTGIHIGPEAPTDDSVLWVDTDEEESAEAVPADWNAAEGEPGHVLNRTHYKGMVELVNGTGVWNDDMGGMIIETDAELVAGKTYAITYNGVEYTCTAFDTDDGPAIGNGAEFGLEDTGEPFIMLIVVGMLLVFDLNGATEATVRIVGETVVTLPREYLPSMSCVIDVEDVDTDNNNKFVTLTYNTTELVQFLKNGLPVWLNITGGTKDNRVQVTSWCSFGMTIDEQIANGISPAALKLVLCGKELDLDVEYKWVLQLNMSD